jgi:probable phosphoglycerate mutase
MTDIILIRHGENDYTEKGKLAGRMQDVHLNARGVAQAKAVANALKTVPLKAVYSSPLDRTLETAKPIALSQKREVTTRWGLEETDVGDWAGKSIRRLSRSKAWQELQLRPARFRFPGGESMQEQQARLIAEIEELLSMHRAKDVIACVSHSDPIKLIIAHYLGLPLDLFQRLQIDTASMSRLHFDKDGFSLMSLNERVGE